MSIFGNESDDQVLLVGATNGIKDYEQCAAYICKADRFSKSARYMAFYHGRKIDKRVPQILGYINRVILANYSSESQPPEIHNVLGQKSELACKFLELAKKLTAANDPRARVRQKIIFLTGETDPRTTLLADDIPNDKVSKSGKVTRFVQSQRYLSFEKLKTATSTSELEASPLPEKA